MTVLAALAAGRRAHERLMVDECTVDRLTAGALNTTTGAYSPTTANVYTGSCRVLAADPAEGAAGDSPAPLRVTAVMLPAGSTSTVERGDVVTVTASTDPRLLARALTVQAVDASTTSTGLRLEVQDRQ